VRPVLFNDTSAADPGEDIAALFLSRREPMARLAYVLTSNAQASDEIVQDAFLKMHLNWARIDNPVGYLRTSVVNGCHSYHRRRIIERRQPDPRLQVVPAEADEISDALAKLPFAQRAVLALRFYNDLPDDQIAAALGIRQATVRTRVHRGLAALRKEMQS
jgi:RNA polymerase sigma factor (sigma-70 family)